MPSDARLTLRLRLEDVVALAFFLISLLMRLVFRGLERRNLSPADVLIIIPAVALLLAKELVHYFLSGRTHAPEYSATPGAFARHYWEILRDWFPFFFILLMYYSLWGDSTQLLTTQDQDPTLIAVDQKLFGFQASLALQRFISRPLTAWMDAAYFFHVLNIPIVACFIYVKRTRWQFREMMSGLMVVCFFGLLGYLLVPAIGPIYTLRDRYTVPLDQSIPVFNRQVEFMDFARIKRDVFPSMHVAISFVVWLYAHRNSRRLFWILSPFILSLWVSTVYLRYHYLIDVVAGLILAPLCYWLSNFLFARFAEVPLPLAVPAAWVEHLPGPRRPERKMPRNEKVEPRSRS
jgi:membrane-associated phospholipid phosphatase